MYRYSQWCHNVRTKKVTELIDCSSYHPTFNVPCLFESFFLPLLRQNFRKMFSRNEFFSRIFDCSRLLLRILLARKSDMKFRYGYGFAHTAWDPAMGPLPLYIYIYLCNYIRYTYPSHCPCNHILCAQSVPTILNIRYTDTHNNAYQIFNRAPCRKLHFAALLNEFLSVFCVQYFRHASGSCEWVFESILELCIVKKIYIYIYLYN